MPANTTPIFVKTPKVYAATVASNVSSVVDGSGSITLVPAAAEGVRLHSLVVSITSTFSGGQLGLWVNKGGTHTLIDMVYIPNISLSNTTDAYHVDLLDKPWIDPNDKFLALGSDCSLTVGTLASTAVPLYVVAMGGEY